MCTVSYICSGETTIITSNRDEQAARPSLAPAPYEVNGKKLLFPKDPRAGGSWFGCDDDGNVFVLLNGAFEWHRHAPPYRRSRGLIALDVFSAGSPLQEWPGIDLREIEPFTLLLFERGRLFELRWDGSEKSTSERDASRNHIWSSATLYPKEVRERRERWFSDFIAEHPNPTSEDILGFHQHAGSEDAQNGLVIRRESLALQTLSITQATMHRNRLQLTYLDLVGQQRHETACLTI